MFGLTETESAALLLSLRVAAVSLAITLPLALFLGWVLARKEFVGKTALNVAVHLPLVMPPVVTGYLLLLLLGREWPVGAFLEDTFGLVFAFRWTGAALAAGVMSLPLIVRPIRLAVEAVDPGLEAAASTLGAGRVRRFLTIALPLAAPGVIAGAILGFAKSLGEFGATITFVSNIPGETQTLALAIQTLLEVPGREAAVLRLTLIAVGLSVVALVASEIVARRLKGREL